MCRNDELSSTMSWVGCLLQDSERFYLICKISVIPILLTFIYLVALKVSKQPTQLIVQLNSSLRHIIVTKDIQRVNYIVVEKAHKCFIKPCFQVKYNKMTHRNLQQAIWWVRQKYHFQRKTEATWFWSIIYLVRTIE